MVGCCGILKEEDFIKELKKKVINLNNHNHNIFDPRHCNQCFYNIEQVVNHCINYFLEKKTRETRVE